MKSKGVAAQDQEQSITEDEMAYFKQDREASVKDQPINFPKAQRKIEGLGHGGYDHFIGFTNTKTGDMIQFARYEMDGWYADAPINPGKSWDGYLGMPYGYRVGNSPHQDVPRRGALVSHAAIYHATVRQ